MTTKPIYTSTCIFNKECLAYEFSRCNHAEYQDNCHQRDYFTAEERRKHESELLTYCAEEGGSKKR